MSDNNFIQCPANGCEYEGPIGNVSGHWGGTDNEAHKGKFTQAFTEMAENVGKSSETSENEGSEGGDPLLGEGSKPEKEDLPCGHEAINMAEAPDTPFVATCEECGESYKVKE